MAKSPNPRDGVLSGGLAAAARVLLAAAAAISGYLLSVSLTGGGVVGCAPGSSCDAVLQSRWAYALGVPVSAFAVMIDVAVLFATFACRRASTPKQRRNGWEIILPGSILVLGAALWFIALQAVILKRFCPWCMAAHACGSIAALLLLSRLPVREKIDRPDKEHGLSRARAVKLAGFALLAIAVFGVAQVAVAPKTYSVQTIDAGTNVVSIPAPPVTPATPKAPAFLDVYGGAVRLNLDEVPVWGSSDAPHKLVSLYDYTCHHCEIMHSRVVEVQRAFSNQLAVISLPMPLDSSCNPTIRATPRAHTNACDYARLGLAVWRAKPSAILAYDDWFFEVFARTKFPPSMLEATQRAVELVGDPAKFESAATDPWIEEQLKKSITIYVTGYQRFRNGSMPQFVIGTNLVSGTLETARLMELVGKYVNVPK